MICFIYDYSNDGILWTGRKIFVANKIKEGLLDVEMTFLHQDHPAYEFLRNIDVVHDHIGWNSKSTTFVHMPEQNINPLYLEKKRLAQLRSKIIPLLYKIAHWASRKIIVSPVPEAEGDIEKCLANCNPELEQYDFSITEYAQINEMPVAEAYKELKLRTENYRTQRLRIYSQFENFSTRINRATTVPEIQALYEEIIKKFIKDAFI